jgi:hypothetical protein
MLINISEGFLVGLEDVNDNFVDSFQDLISQHVKSFHYVCATRKVIKEIELSLGDRLSSRVKNALVQIAAQSDSSLTLLKSMKCYLELRQCGVDGLLVEENAGVKIWVCSVAYANQWLSHPVKIIGENISDGEACLIAGRHFSVVNRYPERMQKATLEMSGGCGDADTVLSHRLDDAIAPILCIIDSDKLSPTDEGSPAIKKCLALIGKKPGVAIFYCTPSRELENILPLEYLNATVDSLDRSPDRDRILDNMTRISYMRVNSPAVYSFVDLKNGTCCNWVANQNATTINHYAAMPALMPCDCTIDCDGKISPPILKILLEKVVSRMKTGSKTEINNYLDIHQDSSWLEFGSIVFSMSIANNIRLT